MHSSGQSSRLCPLTCLVGVGQLACGHQSAQRSAWHNCRQPAFVIAQFWVDTLLLLLLLLLVYRATLLHTLAHLAGRMRGGRGVCSPQPQL